MENPDERQDPAAQGWRRGLPPGKEAVRLLYPTLVKM